MLSSRSRKRRQLHKTNPNKRPAFERLESRSLLAVTIDTFDTMQIVEDPPTPPPAGLTAASSVAAPETIGGERDMLVDLTSQFGELVLSSNFVGQPLLSFSATATATGSRQVVWDGADGDPNSIATNGLSNFDLTEGGANSRFEFEAGADLVGGTVTLTVYTNGGVATSAVAMIPNTGGALGPTITIPFSAFVGADFTDVGAIELQITGTAAVDGQIDELIATGDPAIHIEKLTNNQDADVPMGPIIPVGQMAVFTYQITNTGSVALENVVVMDDNGTPGNLGDDFSPMPMLNGAFNVGDTNMDNLLDLTEIWLYSSSRVVTAGQYTNIADVTGTDPATQQMVVDDDPSNHFGQIPSEPGIHIEKLTNNQDADLPMGPVIPVGQMAMFTYQVTNTGNVALANVVVTDDNGTPGNLVDDFNPTPTLNGAFNVGDTNMDNLLDLTEIWLYSASRVVTTGQYTNIATVTGVDPATQQMVSDIDPSNHFGEPVGVPVIHIEKLTNNQDADLPTGPMIPVGGMAMFTYQVTNPGTVALANVVVTDDNGTPGNLGDDFNPLPVLSGAFNIGDTNMDNLLDVGEQWLYTGAHLVTAGQYTNIAKVTGVDSTNTSNMVMDDDPSNHFGQIIGQPDIHIEKLTNNQDADLPTGPMIPVGQNAVFTYQVTNPGTVALANVVVSDDNGTPGNLGDDFPPPPVLNGAFNIGDTNTDNLLDTGETWLYSAARVVTAGQYTNIAKVTGVDSTNTSNMVMDDDPSNHFGQVIGQPNIHIEKLTNNQDADLPTGPIIPVGQNAVFTYQVTNPGTVALASVVVSDDNGTPGNLGDDFLPTPVLNGAFNIGDTNTDNLLDTGETWLYSAARVVTAGQYTNIAKVTGVDSTNTSNMVMDDDPSNHFGQQTQGMPAISIVKTANDAPDGEVELIDGAEDVVYTYTVTNTGTTFLSDIDVIDDAGTPGDTSDDIFVGTIDGPLAPNESETLTNTIFVDMDIVNKAAAFGTPTDANGIPTGQDPVMDMDDAEVALHNKIEGRVFVEKKGKIEKPKHKTSFDKYGSYFDKYSSIFDKFKHGYGSKHGKDWDGKGDHEDEGNGHGDNGHGDNGHGDNGHDDHDDKHVKGIEGVKITLTRLDKDVPAQVTYTDEWGFYKFDWLEPGVYKVTQEQPHNFADGPNIPGEIEGENEEIGIIEYEHGVMDDMFTNIELSNGACAHGFDFVERMHSKRGLLSKYTEIFDSVWSAFDNLTSHVGSHGDSYSSGTGHEGDNSSHDDSSHDSESQSIYSSGGYSSSSSSHDSFFGAYGSWVGSKYSKWW